MAAAESRSGFPAPRLRDPRRWPALVGVALLVALAWLPWPLLRALGRVLGGLGHLAWGPRRRIAARNLRLAFPALDATQRDALVRANFASLGIGIAEFLRAWWGPIAPLAARVEWVGFAHLERACAAGRGVILVSGHFHTLELCGRLATARVPLAGLYRAHREPVFEWAVRRGRARYASAMFRRDELRPALRHLKAGGVLWYAPDQDMIGRDAVFAPFFGIEAHTITATAALARMSGAAVIGFAHRRSGDGGYRLAFTAPLDDFPSGDARADAARVNALIESMVRDAPAEYLWIHRRFKRRPDGEASLYDPR